MVSAQNEQLLSRFHGGYLRKPLACKCPRLDCQCSSRFLLIQVLITQWQPLQKHQVQAQVLRVDVRSLPWQIFNYFISLNSHLSWHPYQLNPVMFYQFHTELTTIPD